MGILQGRPIPVPQETLEAIFPFQLPNDLVKCLAEQSFVIQCERRVADAGEQGGVRVLGMRRGGSGPTATWRTARGDPGSRESAGTGANEAHPGDRGVHAAWDSGPQRRQPYPRVSLLKAQH